MTAGGVASDAVTGAPTLSLHIVSASPNLTIGGIQGATYRVEYSTNLLITNWTKLSDLYLTNTPFTFIDSVSTNSPSRFYRASVVSDTNAFPDMVLIPAGAFMMGNSFTNEGAKGEFPRHDVTVSAFYMDKWKVTKALWDEVASWAVTNGFNFDSGALGKAATHPAHSMTWYDAVKWCNARSQKMGLGAVYYTDAALTQVYRSGQVDPYANWSARGYRLPTEAEWEKAARGGLSDKRFPWGDTISQSQANYYSTGKTSYDVNPTQGFHPLYAVDPMPYTSPVGSFAANGYGLYDMAGNLWEWCWDAFEPYSSSSQTDPRGPAFVSLRMLRGGGWGDEAFFCRTAERYALTPDNLNSDLGFRTVVPLAP